jgi:hypothetical protein
MLRWHAAALAHLYLRPRPVARPPRRRGRDHGFVSVESIGWIGIAIAVVAIVGLIVKSKLAAMASSLPDTLGW